MDRIYIKENQPKAETKSSKWIIIAAAILVLLGVVGLIYSLNNNQNQPAQSSTSTTDEDVESNTTTDPDTTTGTSLTGTDAGNDTDLDPDTTPTDTTDTGSGAPVYAAPTDTTKLNIYFQKSPLSDTNPTYYYPVLRDKPADKLQSFVITQTLNGPTKDESAQGYKKAWSFSGTSKCSGSLYRFNMSGTTLTLTICKDFSGESSKLEEALLHSLSEVSNVKKVEVVNASGEAI